MMSEPRVIVKNVSENGISADFHILWYKISVITGLRHSMKKIWNLLIKVVNLTPINQENMTKNNLEENFGPKKMRDLLSFIRSICPIPHFDR